MLEEKIVELTKEVVALRKVMEGGAGAKPAGTKPAGTKAAAAKKVEPTHDKDEVNTILRKVSADISRPAAREIIGSFGAKDLADLLTKPEHFDAAYEAAEAALNEAGGEEAVDDEI